MSTFFPDDDAPATPEPPQRPPAKKKRHWLRNTFIVIAALLIAVVGAGTWYALSLERKVNDSIKRVENLLPPENPSEPGQSPRPKKEVPDSLNYVLMGSDSRDPGAENGRSDSLMIVHLNAKRDHAYIVSFPRDMWVDIPGHGKNKINAAYSFGGPQLTVATMESLLDTRMDHLAIVDFEGFISLTTELGGVTINNKHAFKSHGFDYPKGQITISGDEALWFVRERKALPNGDLDRSANQRKVLQAVLTKGLSPETITDPAKFTSFVSGVAKHLTVDSALTSSEIRSTALSLRMKPSDISQLQAPISGFGTAGGQSIDVVDEAKLKELSTALKKDTMDEYVKKYPQG